jgi:hypothetical protein
MFQPGKMEDIWQITFYALVYNFILQMFSGVTVMSLYF